MKKFKSVFALLFVIMCSAFLFSACGQISYKINFIVDNEIYSTINTKGNETIQMPQNPTKDGYTFDGWYWDEDVWERPFTANSLLNEPLSSDMKVYAKFNLIITHSHSYVKHDAKEPTCVDAGNEEYYTCECGLIFSQPDENFEITEIPVIVAKGHDFSEWEETIAPTYTTQGEEKRSCKNCEYFETREIDKLQAQYTEPTELKVENSILKWDGFSPYGYSVVINNQTYQTSENDFEFDFNSTDYNSAKVALIYEDNTTGNYIEFNNFIVNEEISDLHFVEQDGKVNFSWNNPTSLYEIVFELNGVKTNLSKTATTYQLNRSSINVGDTVNIYVNGAEITDFYASKKVGMQLKQLSAPIVSIDRLSLVWDEIENADYYIANDQSQQSTSFSYNGESSGSHSFSVIAYANQDCLSSEETSFEFNKLIMPDISIENGLVSWDAIAGQVRYSVLKDDIIATFSSNNYQLQEDNSDEYVLLLYAETVKDNVMQSDYALIKNYVYEDYNTIYVGTYKNENLVLTKVDPITTELIVLDEMNNVDYSNITSNVCFIANINTTPTIKNLNKNLITSIIIPESVTSICSSAFSGFTGLTSITIPENITEIGSHAFYGCTSLISATIGESVTSIGSYAFKNCTSLTSITIPSSVTSIGESAFSGCSSLGSIILPFVGSSASATTASSSTLFGYIFGTSSYTGGIATKQYYSSSYYSTYYIPSSLKSVTITDGKILYGAFYSCSKLKSVTIGENVTRINEYAFYNTTALTEIHFNATACAYFLSSSNYVFYNSGKSGDGITVTFGDNVTEIPAYLFYPCDNDSYLPKITSVMIGESVTGIGSYAFYGCTSLISATIGENVTSIGGYAFYGCTSLNKVNITNLENWFKINFSTASSNPLYYAHNLYLNDELITDLIISDSITSIGSYAFFGCTSLTSVTIGENVTSIGGYAFYGCTSLTSIVIPNSVISIGSYAFYGCKSLTSITIPNSVTSIGSSAFENCSKLTSIYIPSSVTTISANSYLNSPFYNCSSSLVIYCGASEAQSGWDTYWNYYGSGETLTVNYGYTYEQYLTAIGE